MARSKRWNPRLSRRDFLKWGGSALAGLAALDVPGFLWAAADLAAESPKVLVLLFQRGAADGLNIVVPYGDKNYRIARPTIGLKDPAQPGGVLDLDGTFGLHPALSSLMPLWQQGTFGLFHAVGSPDGTRSHFEAQDNMETGTPGVKTTGDGWMDRAIQCSSFHRAKSPLTAVAISPRLPRILRGDFQVTAFPNLAAYKFIGGGLEAGTFEQMYAQSIDRLLSGVGKLTKASVDIVQKIEQSGPKDPEDAGYPKGPLGRSFFELSRILKARVGTRVGFIDVGGWDHHVNEGSTDGLLDQRLKDLGDSIAAFYRDLGDRARDVLLATMTEFGRTLQENGNRGTDHGHASVMLLFGGGVRGGRVYGPWPGLAPEQLFEGRDLQVTTDFRQVHSEILMDHLGIRDLSTVFPGFSPGPSTGFLA